MVLPQCNVIFNIFTHLFDNCTNSIYHLIGEIFIKLTQHILQGYYAIGEILFKWIPEVGMELIIQTVTLVTNIEPTTVEYMVHFLFSIFSTLALLLILVVYLWLHCLLKKMKDTPLKPLKVFLPEQGFCNPMCTKDHSETVENHSHT